MDIISNTRKHYSLLTNCLAFVRWLMMGIKEKGEEKQGYKAKTCDF